MLLRVMLLVLAAACVSGELCDEAHGLCENALAQDPSMYYRTGCNRSDPVFGPLYTGCFDICCSEPPGPGGYPSDPTCSKATTGGIGYPTTCGQREESGNGAKKNRTEKSKVGSIRSMRTFRPEWNCAMPQCTCKCPPDPPAPSP